MVWCLIRFCKMDRQPYPFFGKLIQEHTLLLPAFSFVLLPAGAARRGQVSSAIGRIPEPHGLHGGLWKVPCFVSAGQEGGRRWRPITTRSGLSCDQDSRQRAGKFMVCSGETGCPPGSTTTAQSHRICPAGYQPGSRGKGDYQYIPSEFASSHLPPKERCRVGTRRHRLHTPA